MGIRKIFLGIAFFLVIQTVSAQQDYASRFFLARNYLNEGNNALAMEIFLPIANNDPDNIYKEQAAYLYTIASMRDSLFFQARQMLLQITTRYSYWEGIDEAKYLLGICYFHAEQPSLALNYGEMIEDEKIKSLFKNVKNYYLNTYDDPNLLKGLYDQFPNDKQVAFRYTQLLSLKHQNEDDAVLLESLIDVFNFNPELLIRSFPSQKVFKDTYNVAVFLPFKYPRVRSRIQYEKNKFAFEYYSGLLQAADSLKAMGINLNIRPFDTRGDTNVLKTILNQQIVAESDLIIGPLFPELSEMMMEYGLKNKINIVNPFAQNERYLEGNPYAYLFQTTFQQMSRLQCQFVIDSLIKDSTALNMIVMDKTETDTLMAAIIYNYLKANGKNIDTIMVFDRYKPEQFLDIFSDSSHIEDFTNMFITSSNKVIIGRIISAVEAGQSQVNILGQSRWLEYDNIDLIQLERRHVYFPYSDYVNFENDYFHRFSKSYSFDNIPDFYSETGFEIMMHFGKALFRHGKYFQEGLKNDGFIPGYLFSGIDYSLGNFNAYAPLIRVKAGELIRIPYRPKVDIIAADVRSELPDEVEVDVLDESDQD